MAYELPADRTVAKAVPRIAGKLASNAAETLASHTRTHERIHDARTSVKKLRGLLRLVQPAFDRRRYDKENRRLRELGDRLSKLRDAEVLVSTFDGLFDHFDDQLGPKLRRVRMRLTTRLREIERRHDLPAQLRAAGKEFERLRRRARRWVPRQGKRDGGWNAIQPGLAKTYARARRDMAAAYDQGDSAAFHEWRKTVKYHGYHVRLLAPAWPAELRARLEALEQLGELLGEDHDLAVFAETLENEPRCFDNPEDRQVLVGLIEQRQGVLRARARPLGRRLFAEKPAAFCRRLHRYWSIWRDEPDAEKAEQGGEARQQQRQPDQKGAQTAAAA